MRPATLRFPINGRRRRERAGRIPRYLVVVLHLGRLADGGETAPLERSKKKGFPAGFGDGEVDQDRFTVEVSSLCFRDFGVECFMKKRCPHKTHIDSFMKQSGISEERPVGCVDNQRAHPSH